LRQGFNNGRSRDSDFSIGFSANFDGMAGRCEKVHLPR
jgi:hypothetical protein